MSLCPLAQRTFLVARLSLALALTLGACVTNDSPSVRACRTDRLTWRAPNSGTLRVLTSEVPGLTIDSARWFSESHTMDLGVKTQLVFAGVLRAAAAIRLDSVAIVYRGRDSAKPLLIGHADNMPIYSAPWTEAAAESTLNHQGPTDMPVGTSKGVENLLSDAGEWSTTTDWIHDCPATVQAIWLHDVVRVRLDEEASRRLSAPGGGADRSLEPTRVVVDTIARLREDLGDELVAAAVVANVSDQPARDVTVGFLGQHRTGSSNSFAPPVDTVHRVYIGTLAPHERRAIQGPGYDYNFHFRYLGAVVSSEKRPLPTKASDYKPPLWWEEVQAQASKARAQAKP